MILKLGCVYLDICKNLNTDHTPLINLYLKARETEGVKKSADCCSAQL